MITTSHDPGFRWQPVTPWAEEIARMDAERMAYLDRELGRDTGPCPECGGPVPATSRSGYCSIQCRRRVGMREIRASPRHDPRNGPVVGQRFGTWRVQFKLDVRGQRGVRLFQVQCGCGRVEVVPGKVLSEGKTQTCVGCRG